MSAPASGSSLARTTLHTPAAASGAEPVVDVPPNGAAAGRDVPLPREVWLALVRERVGAGGHVWVRVRGASMAPALERGAVVRLGALDEGGLRAGEIVLAVLPTGLPVLHRVVRADRDRVRLRGDALPCSDPLIGRDAVLARVTAVRIGNEVGPVPRAARWGRLRYWRGALGRLVRSRTFFRRGS